jgi:murein DD-endopeptidase MepM/ murein hydrolase activator NlpD
MRTRRILALVTALLTTAAPAYAMGDPNVAALQVALYARGVYDGTIDGERGPATTAAVVRFQRRHGLAADGVVGPATRHALGRRGRPPLGSRVLSFGAIGWDVAALQFSLAWHGFPSGFFDGHFGPRVDAALRSYQEWAGLGADGLAGGATYRALRGPLPRSPLAVSWPLAAAVGDGYGPRGDRFHSGIDLPAAQGTPIAAARMGTVTYAGLAGGYGRLVVISHGRGVATWYAHMSRILVAVGQHVGRGRRVGLVGSSGHATGPHLHFEVRVGGAIVDPLTALR